MSNAGDLPQQASAGCSVTQEEPLNQAEYMEYLEQPSTRLAKTMPMIDATFSESQTSPIKRRKRDSSEKKQAADCEPVVKQRRHGGTFSSLRDKLSELNFAVQTLQDQQKKSKVRNRNSHSKKLNER